MTGEMSFKCLVFLTVLPGSYLEPNQKSMVECFCKTSNQVLAINYFRKKALL